MQRNGASIVPPPPAVGGGSLRLADLRLGEEGVVERIDLPEADARRLMELGFLPGHRVSFANRSPFGDPRVFRVDGTEVALRRETARSILLRPRGQPGAGK